MNAYLLTANITRSQPHLADLGLRRSSCASTIVCADNEEEATKRFEDWLRTQPEGDSPLDIHIHKMIIAPLVDQLLTETASVPLDWPQITIQAQMDLESTTEGDFEQGYWVDVNAVLPPSTNLEDLRRELPEDISSGLNWAEDKHFFFLLSVLSPPPPPPPESWEEPEAEHSDGVETPEETAEESAPVMGEAEADFPELAGKEAAVLIRARNSAVAAWLWRKYAADTKLAGNQIRIDPWCDLLGLEDEGDLDRVIAEYSKAIELRPDFAFAFEHRGQARYSKGDLEGAIADCTKAIELRPDDARAYLNRGNARKAKGDLDGATEDYTKTIELKPDYVNAYTGRGGAKLLKGELDGAIEDYTKAIRLKPDYARAYTYRGNAKKAQSNFEGAMADYTKALELNPKHAWAYHYCGCLRYDAHEFTDALLDFRRALEVDSSLQDYAHFRVWLVRARLGEAEAARAELQTYLDGRTTGKPDDWASKIGQFLAGQLAEPEFLAAARKADQKTEAGQLCQAYFYAGSKHLFAGDEAVAADYFQKSIATDQRAYTEYSSAAAELGFLKDQNQVGPA